MNLTLGDDWRATVTADPLPLTPRFTGDTVDIAQDANVEERERFLAATFGSQDWLWDTPDILRFDPDSRKLVGAVFQLPYMSAYAETADHVPVLPAVRPGGLRADEVRDFRHEMCAVLCRAPEDAELACLRDLDVLNAPLDARIGIAPDVALLVQHGTVVGWTLTDPARHLTTPFTEPSPTPPSPTTRRLLTECLNLVTQPLFDAVQDDDPAALSRLRSAAQALRTQPDDRPRADALLSLIANLVEDHPDGATDLTP
ncbi:hypothetical protein [Streptomyces sp. YU58]|uniref:hypothetical protein n=1 Tax=Streptomyces sp. SX92 TaxID=3158972 RepID=UPI0027B8AD50|nr:hypothetical protein [Streptomyces coralus]WLW53224.1 hypothetical protein QU709_18370 [Streptomyces coralus]